jgi:hypothetical protein
MWFTFTNPEATAGDLNKNNHKGTQSVKQRNTKDNSKINTIKM